jgi:hypothetical protein
MKRLIITAFAIAGAGRARAEPLTPWARDVPAAQQEQARALFEDGNQLFAQQAHGPALERYRAAVALWDHPMVRFNMAVTEIRLDRVLDAADDLQAALRFGQTPFTPELYQQALDYQALLAGRVGELEVACAQPGAQISLDGKPWFAGPGQRRLRVLAGEHVVAADRPGSVPQSVRVVVAGRAVATHRIALVSFDAAAHLEYPRPRWIAWTIAGGGAAVALGGLAVYLAGRNQMDAFHSDFASVCAAGCEADLASHPLLRRERDSAVLQGRIAVPMIAAGSAIAVGGIVLAILNRPVRTLPRLELAPAPGGVAASAGWRF